MWIILSLSDNEGKILWAIKADGSIYYGAGVPQQVIAYINEKIAEFSLDDIVAFLNGLEEGDKTLQTLLNEKVDKEEGKSLIDAEYASSQSATENPEFMEVELDANDKVLGGRKPDGTKFENVGFETPAINGVKTINGKNISLLGVNETTIPLKEYNLPKYGSVNIKSETFYLTSPTPISDRSEVYIFQDYEATGNNYINRLTLSYYYLVSSLIDNGDGTYSKYNDGVEGHDIKLDFYTGKEVKKVDGVYYVKASLDTPNPIVVYQILGKPDLLTWAVNKDSEHYCLVDVDFGTYLTQQDMTVGVKFQGNSTIAYPKKNLRFTFYKNNEYSKKLKIQIGELIPANKYNLKAYWRDSSLVREHACYRMVQAIRETHDYNDQYPWNEGNGFVPDATGLTNGFPIRVDVGGNFQGVYWFGLAKDINNFMLDDETMNGILIQGDGGYGPTFWQTLDPQYWSDLLADIDNDISEDSLPHVQAWYDYLNGNTFSRETAPAHFNIKNWIDCVIILQIFGAVDMTSSNLILYAGEDKTVFSPMYYDMDWTWGFRCPWNMSTFNNLQTKDQSLWVKIQSILRDEIEARYKELRTKIINMDYITNLIVGFGRQIPYSAYEEEMEKWPDFPLTPTDEGRVGSIESIIDWMKQRILFADSYFNYNTDL